MTARSLTRRTGTAVATLAVAGLAVLLPAGTALADTAPAGTALTGTALTGTAPAGGGAVPAAVTQPSGDLDCPDLSRADAQALLVADPSDPNRLDRDRDGLACEGDDPAMSGAPAAADPTAGDEPRRAEPVSSGADDGQVARVPSGGVEAGGGPAGGTDTGATVLLVGTAAMLAAGAGTAVWSGRRSGRAPRAGRA